MISHAQSRLLVAPRQEAEASDASVPTQPVSFRRMKSFGSMTDAIRSYFSGSCFFTHRSDGNRKPVNTRLWKISFISVNVICCEISASSCCER